MPVANLRNGGKQVSGRLRAVPGVAVVILLLHVSFEYLRPHEIWPILGTMKLQTATTTALTVLVIILAAKGEVRWALQGWLLLSFLGLAVLTFPLATNWFFAYTFAYDLTLILVGYFAITRILCDERNLRRFLVLLVGIHIYLAITGIRGYAERDFTDSGYRSTGVVGGSFLGDENDVALALNIALPLALYLFRQAHTLPRRLLWGLGAVVILVTIVFTFSRGGFIGLAAMAVFGIVTSSKRGKTFGVLALATMLVIAVAPDQYWERMKTIENTDEGTAEIRRYYWAAARRMFLDSPMIWGVGGGNFGVLLPEYIIDLPADRRPNQWGRVAHSLYFELLAEFGLLGVFLIGTILILNVRDLNRVIARSRHGSCSVSVQQLARCVRLSWVGFLLSATFLSVLSYPHLYYLTALTVVVRTLAQEEMTMSERRKRPEKPRAIGLRPERAIYQAGSDGTIPAS